MSRFKILLKILIICLSTVLASNRDYDEESRCVHHCYRDYDGRLSTTISGRRCRSWTLDDINPELQVETNVQEMGYFCRLTNHKPMPWCYLEEGDGVNRGDWEYCFFFSCEESWSTKFRRNFCQRAGYFEYEGRCLTVLPTIAYSFEEGKRMCEADSSELASFRSEKETIFVEGLTCLPKLVSLRQMDNSWQWMGSDGPTLNVTDGDMNWCKGEFYEPFEGQCAGTVGSKCLVKLECENPREIVYPACSYTPEVSATVEDVTKITWKKASRHCNRTGRQLCGFDSLCNVQTSNDADSDVYKSPSLPIPGNNWIPIADEYNDWIYAGDEDSGLACVRYNQQNGPPRWGSDPKVCKRRSRSAYPDICSSIGKVLCCEKNNSIQIPQPSKVKVFIRSRVEGGNAFYQFSKNENVSWDDKDLAQWRKYKRLEGDLRSITLMSGYAQGVAEDPIYFCTRTVYIDELLPTKLHMASDVPCLKKWELNFFLYGKTKTRKSSRTQDTEIFLLTTKINSRLRYRFSHQRPSLEDHIFSLYLPQEEDIKLPPEEEFPCNGHFEKLKDSAGMISSPGYPHPYPKETPPISCQWKVSTEKNQLLKIKFTDIELRRRKKGKYFAFVEGYERFRVDNGKLLFNHRQLCKDDYVNITDPTKKRDQETWVDYGHFCGRETPDTFITTNHAIVIKFQGASSGLGKGFSLFFESIAPPRGIELISIPEDERVEASWRSARGRCRDLGKELCTVEDICKIGRPFYGVERGNQWAPVSEEFNDWVQIGEDRGQTCQRHNVPYGPPLWGVQASHCNDVNASSTPCSFKSKVYCCDTEGLSRRRLPFAQQILVKVYTTFQNGRTYYRYIRDGIDPVEDDSIWIAAVRHSGDLTHINFFTHYRSGFDKVIYFCSKSLVPAIEQMQTVYAMLAAPCTGDWRLLFYLYASDNDVPEEETKRIYVGISTLFPYHSRARFGRFPQLFRGLESFSFFAPTPDFVPTDFDESSGFSNFTDETCPPTVTVVVAPAVVMSPGYPKAYSSSMDCKWRTKLSDADAEHGLKLRIIIYELDLENNMDVLYIYDSPENKTLEQFSKRQSRSYTGSVRGVSLSTNDTFILHFSSDNSLEKKGFKIIVEVVNEKCGGLVKRHGSALTSPDYPRKYKSMLNCTWEIHAPNVGYGIEIQFGKFELKDSENCTEDFVILGAPSNVSQYRFCGVKDFPPRVQFNSSVVWMTFVTGDGESRDKKGFSFNVFFWAIGNLGSVGGSGAKCGEQKIQPWLGTGDSATDRIVGGMEAIPGSWPWVVHLPEATCGGVLLNNRWVLTAGHCFAGTKSDDGTWKTKKNISNYTVVAGRHHRVSSSRNEQVFQVQAVIIHPKYKRARLGNAGFTVRKGIPLNDIALIKLKQIAVFETKTIAPICLPTQDVAVGETCVIAGWGAKELLASLAGHSQDSLHYAHVHTLSNSICNTYEALRGSVTDKMICAGYPGGGVDSCSGDSGGPLMCRGPDRSYQVKGVVSWGRGCGKPNQPGLYTRVWSYYDWISNIIYT